MALDVAILVRAGGSALLALVGIAALLFARRNLGALALGLYLACKGTSYVLSNLGVLTVKPEATTVVYALLLAGRVIGLLGLVVLWPTPLPRRDRRLWTALGLATIVAFLYFFIDPVSNGLDFQRSRSPIPTPFLAVSAILKILFSLEDGLLAALAIMLPLRYLSTRADEGLLRRKLALGVVLVAGIGAGFDLLRGNVTLGQRVPFGFSVIILLAAVLWLVATRREDSRPALVAALGLPTVLFLGMLIESAAPASLLDGGAVRLSTSVGNVAHGIERSAIAFLVAYGILRVAFLGYAPTLRTARRGTLVAGALALLFIVAQVAQNFLAAQYGLLMGGIVAGAFLFAAAPLQSAMQRAREHADTSPSSRVISVPVQAAPPAMAALAYKAALRAAMRDGLVTRREERHIAEVARALGIDPVQAHELRDEVEREAHDGGAP